MATATLTTKYRRITITLDRLIDVVVEAMSPDANELAVQLYSGWPDDDLVAIADEDRRIVDILDGYHRAAGLVASAQASGIDPSAIEIPVLEILDETLIDALASLLPGQSRGALLDAG